MIDIITWLVKVIIICQAVKRDKGLTGDRQPFNNLFSGLSPTLVVLWCCNPSVRLSANYTPKG